MTKLVPPISDARRLGLPIGGPAAAVHALREAIKRRDVAQVQKLRWLAPRPPTERDLLSDMAAAEGLEAAVGKLSRFWNRADVTVDAVRTVSGTEAEVYERLNVPGESLTMLSLVRRESVDAQWRVVCTTKGDDDRLVFWIAGTQHRVDDVRFTRAFHDRGCPGDLLMDQERSGVLGHPAGWLAKVRGPLTPGAWPSTLPGEGGHILELASVLSSLARERHEQIAWLLSAAKVFIDELDGQAAFIPAHSKLMLPQALCMAASNELTPSQLFRFWARIDQTSGYFHTVGLGQLGVPEVEAPVELLDTPSRSARMVRWLGASFLDVKTTPSIGTELLLGDDAFVLVAGRRGARRGKTYGRWGSVGLVASRDVHTRGSRTRIRVPADLR